MRKIINETLQHFLIDYHAWLKNGAKGGRFERDFGLCYNLETYLASSPDYLDDADRCLKELFHSENFHGVFPFNKGCYSFYADERDAGICHLNEKRVAFVEKWSVQKEYVAASDDMKMFAEDYYTWIKMERPSDSIFKPQWGLCANAAEYSVANNLNIHSLTDELKELFLHDGLHYDYPFNEGNYNMFREEKLAGQLSYNEKRLAFVERWMV
jgi:hypothetical protein